MSKDAEIRKIAAQLDGLLDDLAASVTALSTILVPPPPPAASERLTAP